MNLEAKQISESSSRTGYSPAIGAQIHVAGHQFKLAAMCGQYVVVRDAQPVPPGPATIFMQIDDEESVYNVHLTYGIDPSQREQPYTKQ